MSYSSEVLADSPWGFWQETEGSGTTLADSSPNGRALTTVGSPSLQQSGPFGVYSVQYAGAQSARSGTTVSTSNATIEMWVYLTANPSSQTPLFGCTSDFTTGSAYDKYLSLQTDGTLRWHVYTGSTVSVYTSGALSLNTWHHVVASVGAAGAKIRVDKVTTASNAGYTSSYTGAMFPCFHWGLSGMTPPPVGSGDYSGTGTVKIAMPAFYASQLSDSRTDAHYDALAAVTTGAFTAAAPAPTLTVSGSVARTGSVAATASSPALSVTGSAFAFVTGDVAAVASSPTVSVSGAVSGVTSGSVSAVAQSPTLAVDGTVPTPAAGVVSATAASPAVSVTDSTVGGSVDVGVTVEVGALTLLNLVALPGVEVEIGAGLDVGTVQPVVPLPGVTIPVGASLDARPVELVTVDPRHKRTQWRYVITDLANNPLGELTDLQHDPVEDAIGEPATMQFTMPASGDQFSLVKPIVTQCQVWDGNTLRLRGPVLPGQPSDDGSTITYKVHDPSWFWRDGRRVITRIPQRNLLKNGDFRQGLTYWSRGYDKDSLPKAAPTVKVVTDDFAMDTDGLDPIRAAEIEGVESFTQSELSSNAVFYPNLATFRPGGKAAVEAVANAMPTTVGLKVSVVGHTANDGTGNGLGLSARRAEAAKAVILTKRPSAIVSTKGVGYYDPKPGFPIDSQEQRRVVIGYNQTITGKSLQWMKQTLEVTHPKSAKYGLELTASWMLKVADAWSVEDANMMSGRLVARRKSRPKVKYAESNASISDTDPVDRWIPQSTSVTIPADGRTYTVDLYLYAPAARARYAAVQLVPEEMLYFWGEDQATIFRGVMEHIQKPEYGYADLGVGVRAPSTGIKRDRGEEWRFSALMDAETALNGLMTINRGIEWDTLTTATTTTAAAFYPRQGKTVDYVLALGGNVAAASPANTRDVGSQVIVQAQDSQSYRAMAYASDRKAFGGTLIQRVVTAEQDTPLNELGAAAKAELFWSRSSTPAYWVDIDPDSISDVLANTRKGDTVRLILDGAFNVDAQARIVRRQIHPDSLRLMLAFEEA